jgi:hypothetical protein
LQKVLKVSLKRLMVRQKLIELLSIKAVHLIGSLLHSSSVGQFSKLFE